MNELYQYVTDIAPCYHDVGLVLGIRYSKLKVIKTDDTSFPSLEHKCKKMMEVWLETDIHATWKKLCDALDKIEHQALAENIREKYFQQAT